LSPLRTDRGRNTLIVRFTVLWAFKTINAAYCFYKTFLPLPSFRFVNVQSLNIL